MKQEDSKDVTDTEIKVSGCITHSSVIKFVVQVIFSLILMLFSIFMILRSNNSAGETLWVSLLTSTFSLYIPSPSVHK